MKNQQGIALTTVLLFLVILSLFSITMLETAWLATRKSRNQWQKQQTFHAAEAGLAMAEQNLSLQLSHCMIPITSSRSLQSMPLTWWTSSTSCSESFQSAKLYYVVEYLTTDPCVQLTKSTLGADYFRITVLASQAQTRTILQTTWINPSHQMVQCASTVRDLPVGRQSWQQLV